MKLTVGQTLYWVPSKSSSMSARDVVVEKVGRVWSTICGGSYRIDINTLQADGGSYMSPGRCHTDKEAYLAYVSAQVAWSNLSSGMVYRCPVGVSRGDIEEAAKLLKIDIGVAATQP